MIPNVLTIAGSDPSGGAGIQADLKTFSALGCYGMAAMTALTAQNTRGVSAIHEVPAYFVGAQLKALFEDVRIDAVKIGMVGNVEAIRTLADMLQKHRPRNVVLDPVMVAQSGDKLISSDAVTAMARYLIPLATVLTPNIPEAQVLLGHKFEGDMKAAARALLKLECRGVLLKGGHLTGEHSNDVYADKNGETVLEGDRIKTYNTHGTGCTLASALACYLAKGLPPVEASRAAKKYLTTALLNADELDVGEGHGPVHHFHGLWK